MPLQPNLLARPDQADQEEGAREDATLAEIERLVDSLVHDGTPRHERSYWDCTSAPLLVALLVHVHGCEEEKTLRRATELLRKCGSTDVVELLLESSARGAGVREAVAGQARVLLRMTERERSCVVACALGHLESWDHSGASAGSSSQAFVRAHLTALFGSRAPAAAA
jgi:type IV secretory pathway TraG/TraD family ATPase VirD4